MPLARKTSSSGHTTKAKKQSSKDKRQSKTAPAKSKSQKVKASPPEPPRPKKSKSLDKPKSAAKPPAPTVKSAGGRQHSKTATASAKVPAKSAVKSGQKGAVAGDTNAGLVIAYGSAPRTKPAGPGGLLTARHHRSSGSPAGEAITPPYGDVRTMVCDVSPVPSDVESIDFCNASKPPPDRRGLFGRSQQTLRVGHHDKKNHTAKGIRHSDSHPGEAPKSDKTDEDTLAQTSSEDQEETTVKNEIAVRIVPDSARQKPMVGTKETEKVAATTSHSKAHGKEAVKQQKVQVTTTAAPQKLSTSKEPNPKAPLPNAKSLKNAKSVKTEKLQLTRKPKTATEDKAKLTIQAPEDSDCKARETAADTTAGHHPSEPSEEEPSNVSEKDKDVVECSEMAPTFRIKADEECCKAFAILNSKGIRVSLRTLRRALLTPTEYRLLQSTGQISDN